MPDPTHASCANQELARHGPSPDPVAALEERLQNVSDELAQVRSHAARLEAQLDTPSLPGRGLDVFRLLVDSCPQAAIITDLSGEIRMINTETEWVFGFREEELSGSKIENLLDLEDRGHFLTLQTTVSGKPEGRLENRSREFLGKRRDASSFPLDLALRKIEVGGQVRLLASIFDISAQVRVEQSIRDSLAEKETLLQEIHHRVKNNMQLISSLLSLQRDQVKDPEAAAVFRECQNRIRSMALIHEKLYQSTSLSHIGLAEYMGELVSILRAAFVGSNGTTSIKLEIEPVEVEIDTAIPMGLIVNEIVSNSFKHAFPDQETGRVEVRVRKTALDELELTIRDNGVGFPGEFDWTAARSLGLRLVRILTEQLSGNLEMSGLDGTTFRLLIPKTWSRSAR